MGTISFFIEFVFPFLAISSSPQYLCIDFSLCLFINVYKAFREPRERKVSKYLAEEELKHWAAVFLLTLGSISSQPEPCSGMWCCWVFWRGWGCLNKAMKSTAVSFCCSVLNARCFGFFFEGSLLAKCYLPNFCWSLCFHVLKCQSLGHWVLLEAWRCPDNYTVPAEGWQEKHNFWTTVDDCMPWICSQLFCGGSWQSFSIFYKAVF